MLAAIQVDVVKAQIERDQALLKQKEELYRKKAIPLIELEIARLKDLLEPQAAGRGREEPGDGRRPVRGDA